MKKEVKTNAIRIIESSGINYQVITYDETITNGVKVSEAIGINPENVFKTLVTVNNKSEHFVFMIPVQETLNLKKASIITNSKYIEMIPQKDLLPLTGYIHGGCSPIGMKKMFPTFIDEVYELYDDIYFSGGRVGVQVKIKSADLIKVINITKGDLV